MPIITHEHKGFKEGNYVYSNQAAIGSGIYRIESFWFWNGSKEPEVHFKDMVNHWPFSCIEHVFKVS